MSDHVPELEQPEEPEPQDYDPGPEVDDEGGASEYRNAARWAEVERAEYERDHPATDAHLDDAADER